MEYCAKQFSGVFSVHISPQHFHGCPQLLMIGVAVNQYNTIYGVKRKYISSSFLPQ